MEPVYEGMVPTFFTGVYVSSEGDSIPYSIYESKKYLESRLPNSPATEYMVKKLGYSPKNENFKYILSFNKINPDLDYLDKKKFKFITQTTLFISLNNSYFFTKFDDDSSNTNKTNEDIITLIDNNGKEIELPKDKDKIINSSKSSPIHLENFSKLPLKKNLSRKIRQTDRPRASSGNVHSDSGYRANSGNVKLLPHYMQHTVSSINKRRGGKRTKKSKKSRKSRKRRNH